MKLFLTVPHQRYYSDEIVRFKDAALAAFRARGWSLIWDPIKDRPTMACRNNQVNRFLSTPCDAFLTLDHDCLPTTRDGRPDLEGLMHLIDDLATGEIDVVGGWTLMHFEHNQDLVPCIAHAAGTNPKTPDEWPINFVAPYSKEPLTELKGGGLGAHCIAANRPVFEAMRAAGRLYFEDVHDRDPASPTFGGRILGHDFAFCQLAMDLGFRVWMDNRVFWGHAKEVDLRWIHDLVKGQAERIDAHLAVAEAFLFEIHDDDTPAWMMLRAAEEAAICDGFMVGTSGIWDVFGSITGDDDKRFSGVDSDDRDPERMIDLLAICALDNGKDLLPMKLARGATVLVDKRNAEILDTLLAGVDVIHIEDVGEGGVIRCA